MELKSWGVPYTPAIRHSIDFCCLECDWSYSFHRHNRYNQIIGFSKNVPPTITQIRMAGGIIIECPKCFSIFWIHLQEEMAERAVRNCENWPR